jgi:hypothetical protein
MFSAILFPVAHIDATAVRSKFGREDLHKKRLSLFLGGLQPDRFIMAAAKLKLNSLVTVEDINETAASSASQ